jgi:hypothetical protein
MPRDPEVRRLNAPKGSQCGKRISGPLDPEGRVVRILCLWVKALWEEQVHRSLKLPNPEELKWIVVIGS